MPCHLPLFSRKLIETFEHPFLKFKMKNKTSILLITLLFQLGFTTKSIGQKHGYRLYDAHVHFSIYGDNAIDSLLKYGVYGARDCGGDFVKLKAIKDQIDSGKKRGPKLYLCGPFLDGPKNSELRGTMTITINNSHEAIKAVDSLAKLKVDFIKTHNGLNREAYFTIIKEAREKGLKVVSHVPKGIPVWEATARGVTCIEHVSESILASPIYAGFAKSPDEAAQWWLTSPKADSIIVLMAKQKVFLTPTLIAFKQLILIASDPDQKNQLEKGMTNLMKITKKFHDHDIRILAGSDFYTDPKRKIDITPGKSLLAEIELLQQAGLSEKEAFYAASNNFEKWLKSK